MPAANLNVSRTRLKRWLGLAQCLLLLSCASEEQLPPTVSTAQPTWTRESGAIEPRVVEPQQALVSATPAPPPYAVSLASTAEADADRHMASLAASETAVLHANEVGYYVDTLDARLIQVLKDGDMKVSRSGDVLTLALEGSDLFSPGGVQLSDAARAGLKQVFGVLAEYDRTRILVAGYTDDKGEAGYNETLSVKRARAIADLLIDAGVNATHLLIVGYGESNPVASNGTEQGRARNRRVVLTVEPLQRPESIPPAGR